MNLGHFIHYAPPLGATLSYCQSKSNCGSFPAFLYLLHKINECRVVVLSPPLHDTPPPPAPIPKGITVWHPSPPVPNGGMGFPPEFEEFYLESKKQIKQGTSFGSYLISRKVGLVLHFSEENKSQTYESLQGDNWKITQGSQSEIGIVREMTSKSV